MGRLLYHDDLAKGLEGTMKNAQDLTGSLADITSEIKGGKGSLGRLLYNDTLAKSLEGTAAHASTTMATINDAAFGFSENMKALQGNFLFKGYFKRQAKAKEKAAAIAAVNIDSSDIEMNDADLAEIEAAAQKAQQAIIDRKKKEKEKQ
jgi:phospholipid/cholesterol/gamma-HCH transport system substrate-binding protein